MFKVSFDWLDLTISRFLVYLFYKVILSEDYRNYSWLIIPNETNAENSKNASKQYDTASYVFFEKDTTRNKLYQKSIDRIINGKKVLDIGTGGLAYLSNLALKAGAKNVVAIEASKKQLQKAKERMYRYPEDRLRFVEGYSTDCEELGHFDVVLHEIIGSIASNEGCVFAINDAKQRFLKPDGLVLPHYVETEIHLVRPFKKQKISPKYESLRILTKILGFTPWRETLEELNHSSIYNFPTQSLIACTVEKISENNSLSVNSALLESIPFNKKGLIDSIQKNKYKLKCHKDETLSGLAFSIRLQCEEKGELIDSMRMKTNWVPIYLHLDNSGITVGPTKDIYLESIADLSSINPKYSIKVSTDSWSKSYEWSGCD